MKSDICLFCFIELFICLCFSSWYAGGMWELFLSACILYSVLLFNLFVYGFLLGGMREFQIHMFYQLVLSVSLVFSRRTAPWKHLIIGGLTTIQSSGRRLRSIRGGVKKNLVFFKWCLNFQDFKMGCGLREAFSLVTILLSNVVKVPIFDDIYFNKIVLPMLKILHFHKSAGAHN